MSPRTSLSGIETFGHDRTGDVQDKYNLYYALISKYVKALDELNNTIEIEIKIWQLPEPTKDKPHGYRYSLAYIADDKRVIGYDNAEGKGDHRHNGNIEGSYHFKGLDRLLEDFYNDIEKYKRGKL